MTIKKSITIEVEMTSGASEACLSDHMSHFIGEIKGYIDNMRYQSWHNTISTSWDESEKVEIDVKIS